MTLDLIGLHELAELLGVSRQRADQLMREKGAPDPAALLRAGRVWLWRDIDIWLRQIGRS